MSSNLKDAIGYTIGIVWLVAALSGGYWLFDHLSTRYGELFGGLSLFYVLAWVGLIFAGRAILEFIVQSIIDVVGRPVDISETAADSNFQILEWPYLRHTAAASIIICASTAYLGGSSGLQKSQRATQVLPDTYVAAKSDYFSTVNEGDHG